MELSEVVIGMKAYPQGDRASMGTITKLPNEKGEVRLQYKGTHIYDDYHVSKLNAVDPEKDKERAAELQVKIDQAKTAFEAAFQALDAVRSGIQGDMCSFEDEGLISMRELEMMMEDNGWSSSSLYC
jgi:hypothetical protein